MSLSNSLGLLGRKVGMTRIFTEDGKTIPVTVVDVSDNRVSQLKTKDVDGYSAVQVTFGERKASRVTRPLAGHWAKAGVRAGQLVREFRVSEDSLSNWHLGGFLRVNETFTVGQKIDVQGVSIGKGFAGTIKRHNFHSQRASHGNSRSHNVPGSISMAQDPGRVFPGKKMAGHLGDETVTVQNLEVVRLDLERQLLLVKGAVPGSKDGFLVLRPAVKIEQAARAVRAKEGV
jgi:large subunit ribosomal protein L3